MVSEKGPAMFPAGSQNGDTAALPAVWTDRAEFEKAFAKLGADAKAALGKMTDEARAKATFPEVLKDCGGCHEKFRAKKS